MEEKLSKSLSVLRNGILYKSCPSCSVANNKFVLYPCPGSFGYRHDGDRPFVQSLCSKCRGRSNSGELYKGYTFIQEGDLIIPAIRILPISKEIFSSYARVKDFLLKIVPERGNTYYYKSRKLLVEKNTLVLLQYSGAIIAYAIYESENEIDNADAKFSEGYKGYYKFLDNSIKILSEPIDGKAMLDKFAVRLSQATTNIRLSHFPVLMELLDETQDDIIEEENKNVEEKTIKEISNFSITGIHSFNAISHGKTKDYIKAHKNQMAVGKLGEELVLKYEKERLCSLGRKDLSEKVEIVSDDSSLGYDIFSYSESGQEIHIEVKSKAGMLKYFDFYISDNEYQKLKENSSHIIYYVSYLRSPTPFLFKLDGTMINESNIKPVLYRVTLDYEINEDI